MLPKSNLFPLLVIFILSFLLRFYKIWDYLFFGFEQGRDALIIDKLYKFSDFVLVGPSTSIGGLFHGPWYYYMLAVPYGLSGGNPLAAIFLLVLIGAFLPLVMFFLASEFFKSRMWGIIAAILTIFSFEYIQYSRWLSNVSPAPLFVALAILMILKYKHSEKNKFFVSFCLFGSIACLFQMILIPQFILGLVLLFLFRLIPIPGLKTWVAAFCIVLILFCPLIVFDFRNSHITLNSLLNSPEGTTDLNLGTIKIYLLQMYQHLMMSLFYIKNIFVQTIVLITILAGTIFGLRKADRKTGFFLLSFLFMSAVLIKISPGNPQYYVAVGIIWILLFCYALKNIIQIRQFKNLIFLYILFFFLSFLSVTNSLVLNKDVFFKTTQIDLNLADQKALLDYINEDSKNNSYRLVAYTIPSLHPEGWEYLEKFYYGKNDPGAKTIYIAIEKDVYPVWENKWTSDLGETTLEFEKNFGLIRLQKRVLIN